MTHTFSARPAPEAQSQSAQSRPVHSSPVQPVQTPSPQPASTFHGEYLDLLDQVRPIRERAERLRRSVFTRAAAACQQAGLDPAWAGTQLHNCLIDLGRGHGWAGVDASLARQSQQLYSQQFAGYRVYERYLRRLELELRRRWGSGDAQ